jgi:Na+-transporting methylmalonyl-CoA/oxaloacetate decarboxylase gamma subunit
MGMMGMGLMMVLGIAAVIIMSLVVIAAVSRVAASRFSHEPLPDDNEKPKRSRLILSDDGELLEIADSD